MFSIGMAIRIERVRRRWSQQDLADRVGLSVAQIGRIERDDRKVLADELGSFAAAFDMTPADLLDVAKEEGERAAQG